MGRPDGMEVAKHCTPACTLFPVRCVACQHRSYLTLSSVHLAHPFSQVDPERPVLVDKYLDRADELDVDALAGEGARCCQLRLRHRK